MAVFEGFVRVMELFIFDEPISLFQKYFWSFSEAFFNKLSNMIFYNLKEHTRLDGPAMPELCHT
jgi:hypothetical protein